MDQRYDAMIDWLAEGPGLRGCRIEPASMDASFRRYFRVFTDDKTFVVMDAPPTHESCLPFIDITARLLEGGVNAPQILHQDIRRGFLLLSDLGDQQYLQFLDEQSVETLYTDAIQTLVSMQHHCRTEGLPPYDEELLHNEMMLFHDWLLRTHLGYVMGTAERNALFEIFNMLVVSALEQPRTFVHRDYHSRNLLVWPKNNPAVLDYQDAVCGPVTYDIVSLLKDCYIKWPDADIKRWLRLFHDRSGDRLAKVLPEKLQRWFDLMGVQRHLKASGIFCRLYHRDGKAGYLQDVPRTLSYIVDLSGNYPELAVLCELLETVVLPGFGEGAN